MSGNNIQFGIRITGDGSAAVEAARRVEQAYTQMGDKVQMSAKGTRAAMAMIPAQMTDIVAGLATGQSPFTVLIQQGGQLKDMFGGIGPATRAVGTYVAGLVNPFTVAAAAAGTLAYAISEGAKESGNFAKTLIITGNAAATSVAQLQSIAAGVANATGATKGAAAEALNALAGTGRVAADSLGVVADAAIRMERAGVQSIDASVAAFAELGKSPVEASLKLNDSTHHLTLAIYEQIKSLQDQGKESQAAAVAQSAYATEMAARSKEIEANLMALGIAWRAVKDAAKGAWDAMVGLGRDVKGPIDSQIYAARQRQAAYQADIDRGVTGNLAEIAQRGLEQEKANIARLQSEEKVLDVKRKQSDAVAAQAQLDQAGLRYLDKKAQKAKEIEWWTNKALQAGWDEKRLRDQLVLIEDKYAEKVARTRQAKAPGVDPGQRAVEDWQRRLSVLQAEGAGVEKLTAVQEAYASIMADIASGRLEVTSATKLSIEVLGELSLRQEAVNATNEDQLKLQKLTADAREREAKALQSEVESLTQDNEKLAEHNQEIGLSVEAMQQLTLRRLDDNIAKHEARLADEKAFDATSQNVALMEKEIELLKQRRELTIRGQQLDNMVAARNEVLTTFQSIDSTAHSVFVSVAEGGENAFKRIGKTLKSAVLDLLYQITIKRWLIQVAASASGTTWSQAAAALGGGGGGGGGVFGAASNGMSLYNLGSSLGSGTTSLWGLGQAGYAGAGMTSAEAAAAAEAYRQAGYYGVANSISAGNSLFGATSVYGAYGSVSAGAGAAAGLTSVAGATSGLGTLPAGVLTADAAFGSTAAGVAVGEGVTTAGGAAAAGEAGSLAGLSSTGYGVIIAAVILAVMALMPKGGGPKSGGSGYANTYGGDNNAFERRFTPDQLDNVFQAASAGVLDSVGKYMGMLGIKSTARVAVGMGGDMDPNGSADNRVNHVVLKDGRQVAFGTGDYGRGTDEFQAGIAEQIKASIVDALAVSLEDVDKELARQVSGFKGTAVELQAFVSQLATLRNGLERVTGKTGQFSGALVDVLGGISNAATSLSNYYNLFFSDSEKLANAQADLRRQFVAFNITMPATKAEFRKLVESLDLTTASGRATFATLMQLAPAFAEIADQADAAAAAAKQAADQERQARDEAARAVAEAAAQARQQTIETFRQVTASLRGFLDSLHTGPLSDASPEQQYLAAKSAFASVGKRASLGDLTAMQSLQQVAQTFLEASRGWFASSAGYSKDLAAVESLLTRVVGVGNRAAYRGFASGGLAQGLFVAGEAGPELIYSAGPARVLNHSDSRALLDSRPIVAGLDAVARATDTVGERLDARLARLERALAAIESEQRLRNAA